MQRNNICQDFKMFNESQLGSNRAVIPYALMISTTLLLGGCASTEKRTEQTADSANFGKNIERPRVDPYEGFNRSMYGFNMKVDKYLLKPVANGYKWVTPDFMQTGVTNFFTNLKGINVFLNDVFQGKFEQSARDAGRFTTNTTIGLFGLFDVASEFGLENNVEDFGQTLAIWGVDQGPYLVLPLFGPTTLRDGSGVIFDKAANPGTYFPGTGIVEGINDRANAEGALNFIDEAALDPYVFTRESFLQYRQNLVNDGKTDAATYDIDIDAEVDVGEISSAKPKEASGAQKPKSDKAKKKPDDHVENAIDVKTGGTDATAQAFDSMSKSFDDAEREFQAASAKMDDLSKKKRRLRRR
jgi:phospholipid-binding lipoprotein MlaA